MSTSSTEVNVQVTPQIANIIELDLKPVEKLLADLTLGQSEGADKVAKATVLSSLLTAQGQATAAGVQAAAVDARIEKYLPVVGLAVGAVVFFMLVK